MRGVTSREALPSEAQIQATLAETARSLGFLVAHFRAGRTSKGSWLTPVEYDGAGFPDLVIAGYGRVFFVEVKGPTGRLSANQERWKVVLEEGWGHDYRLVGPKELDDMVGLLQSLRPKYVPYRNTMERL